MKKISTLLMLILMIILSSSCSKTAGKTSAKLKLNLSGIVNISSGIGSGGAILFGKNSLGETFGKKITSAEENLDLPNGTWTFYALMWGSESTVMNGKVHCGKSAAQLNGTAATISMSLNNANCTDSEFSGGRSYVSSSLNRFADIFIEECDEVNATTGFSCGLQNQGSALSYRFVFNNYRKTNAGFFVEGESLVSDCKKIESTNTGTNIYTSGLPINFPSGIGGTPFIGSVELFMGNVNCDVTDLKGVHRFPLHQGLATPTSPEHHVLVSSDSCTPTGPDFSGTEEDKKIKCDQFFGTWSSSTCGGTFLPVVTRFGASACSSTIPVASNVAIKHQFVLPKPALCGPYINNSSMIGGHPFSGGEGSTIRPYKICTEWQLNQIGEVDASSTFMSANFKLMNDLDMNKTDFGPYVKPECAGDTGSLLKNHHNLNPLNKVINGTGVCGTVYGVVAYNGIFDGNNKTIKNGRIMADAVSIVGFTRQLGTSGQVKNLNFVNLEVKGLDTVGGIAGDLLTAAVISHVKIEKGEVKSSAANVGGIAGTAVSGSKIDHIKVIDVDVQGSDSVGGLVGSSGASLDKAMFRGSVEQHQNIAGSVGGLVGMAIAGSNITLSFSEGNIISSAQNNGGIAGSNAGVINNAYSTMYINSRYSLSGTRIGGIVGNNTNSSVSNIYSDSILEYTGGGSPNYKDGIVAAGALANNTLCFSSYATSISTCTEGAKTFALMRSGSNFPSYTGWKSDVVGALPRLAWEFEASSRQCLLASNLLTITAQAGLGRGTILNPYIVCSSSQLRELNGAAANTYYRLGEDISIADWVDYTYMISTFSGILDGDNFAIYGLNLTSAQTIDHGIFANNLGTIKNLNVVGNNIIHTGTGATGILTGVNSGTIKDVELVGNNLDGVNYVGSLSGSNSGIIYDVSASVGLVRGQYYVGGITGSNDGTLSHASARVKVSDAYPTYMKFGGVAGANGASGIIDQVIFGGRIENVAQVSSNPAASVNIGGIAGYNAGTISNSMTENYSLVSVKNYENVGGLVGSNDGSVYKSFTLGSLNFNYSGGAVAGGSKFHQLIGLNSGTFDPTNTFYLENHAGAIIGTPTAASACSGGYLTFASSPSYITIASGLTLVDMVAPTAMATSGNTLKNYSTFAAPTTDYVIGYAPSCAGGDAFNAFKSFDESGGAVKKSITDFANISVFSYYDIAYTDTTTPGNSTRQDDLLEYYKAMMENRTPTRPSPIWELESSDGYPRLIQVDKH